jgi:hypothetical protein
MGDLILCKGKTVHHKALGVLLLAYILICVKRAGVYLIPDSNQALK